MTKDLPGARWRRSSRSGAQSHCVELAQVGAVRDSKNPGPALRVDVAGLVGVIKAGRLAPTP